MCIFPYTSSQNLGQAYNGKPRYKSTNECGKCTGVGYGFEDLTKQRLEKKGHEVKSCNPYKDGVDFSIDGQPVQLKCCSTARKTAESFYDKESGRYRYEGQIAMVPSGQSEEVKKIIETKKKNGHGGPTEVLESPVTQKEAVDYTFRGPKSFGKDITDPNLIKEALLFAGIVACFVGIIYIIKSIKKEKPIKKIVKNSLLSGLAFGVAALVGMGIYRQTLRPSYHA